MAQQKSNDKLTAIEHETKPKQKMIVKYGLLVVFLFWCVFYQLLMLICYDYSEKEMDWVAFWIALTGLSIFMIPIFLSLILYAIFKGNSQQSFSQYPSQQQYQQKSHADYPKEELSPDYSLMSKARLLEECKKRGLKTNWWTSDKKTLIKLLEENSSQV